MLGHDRRILSLLPPIGDQRTVQQYEMKTRGSEKYIVLVLKSYNPAFSCVLVSTGRGCESTISLPVVCLTIVPRMARASYGCEGVVVLAWLQLPR